MPYPLLTLMVIALDQLVKWLVQTRMFPFQTIQVIPGWLSIMYAQNSGAAFGILQSYTYLFAALTVAVVVVLWWNRRHFPALPRVFRLGIALALGGALGNFIDRIRLGYVIDFIDFHIWPVFNIADIAIVGGVILVAWGLFIHDGETKKVNETGDESDPAPNTKEEKV